MTQPLFIHVIADYGRVDDMAFAEVRQSLRYHLQDQPVHFESFSVPVFDTVSTGFLLAQIALNNHLGERQFFFVNTAPRKDDLKPRESNDGEGLVYFRLPSGVQGVAVNSGYSLSFIKPYAVEMRFVNCETKGSQFRSRDVFPEALGRIIRGDKDALGADAMAAVYDAPEGVLGYTDGYGNLKTTIRGRALDGRKGDVVTVSINGVSHSAKIGDGIFDVADGEIVLAPGSSGWVDKEGVRKRWVECVLRGGSASALFNYPVSGSKIEWS